MPAFVGHHGRPAGAVLAQSLASILRKDDAVSRVEDPGFDLALTAPSRPGAAVTSDPRVGRADGWVAVLLGRAFGANGPLGPLEVLARLRGSASRLDGRPEVADDPCWDLDGDFAFAAHDAASGELILATDPFGAARVWFMETPGGLRFATDLLALRAWPGFSPELDLAAVHTYLTFGCVPAPATLLRGVFQLPAGHLLRVLGGVVTTTPWFELREHVTPMSQADAVRDLRRLAREAVRCRLDDRPAALYLSGGIDSSAVGAWLRAAGAQPIALTLDFGKKSVERAEAEQVARHLGLRCEVVPVAPKRLAANLDRVLDALDTPIGEAVLGPHWLLGEAARAHGCEVAWNGEGGDQLFGGWTSKPMIAAAVYGGSHAGPLEETPAQQYLRSYHKFYGLEGELYGPALAAAATPGQRRAIIEAHLGGDDAAAFLNRVRLTDVRLKGSHNILPRATRMAAGHGLTLNMPLFDRALAAWSFRLPTELKLHGATEKYVLKLAMQDALPEPIVWRRKFGMSVPITDWLLDELRRRVKDLLSDGSVRRRGLLQVDFIKALRKGHDVASETRRRRLGERLWTLVVLERWCRRVIDGERSQS